MDLNWLRDFQALAAQRSFSRAAEDRCVSQPAFSRRIRSLEDAVGVSLIDRETLPLTLTRAGELFLAQADLILKTYEDAIERCRSIVDADDEVIRFATTHSLYQTHYSQRIAPLIQTGAFEANLNSTSWTADQFVTALQQRYCDVILTYWHPAMDFLKPLDATHCDFITLTKDRLAPVARCGSPHVHALEQRSADPVSVLSYGTGSALKPVVEHILSQIMDVPNLLSINQNVLSASIKDMVLAGFGIGWLPRTLCSVELQDGRLQEIGNSDYATEIEVRLYRGKDCMKSSVDRFWQSMSGLAA